VKKSELVVETIYVIAAIYGIRQKICLMVKDRVFLF